MKISSQSRLSIKVLTTAFVLSFSTNFAFSENYISRSAVDKNGLSYEYVENDPLNVRIYTLQNGLKVYLAENHDKPRVQTYISVKAGSKFDPKETTGLAHYLEHLMFKGNSRIGALNWEVEKPLLDTIAEMYERHKLAITDEAKRVIYRQIDSVSQLAAKLVATNELDHLFRSIGADKTNAYTSNEQTVYINDIPSNVIEQWVKLEQVRFSELVPRLFHTELEAVYEEFNMTQDNDNRQIWYTMMRDVFPNHPYGQQTTIGNASHLKNPSIKNIHEYWNKYYIPNNMAICMMGDLNSDSTIAIINNVWGKNEAKQLDEIVLPTEQPMTESIHDTVYGPDMESVYLGFRFDGLKSEDYKYVSIIDFILANGKAGLLDLDLVQQQKVLNAACYTVFMSDYGVHLFFGIPRDNQSLGDVEKLLLDEIEKIKHGDFEDWMIEASVNNMKLDELKSQESNDYAEIFSDCFISDIAWKDYVAQYDEFAKISKADIMAFAQKHYNNFVSVVKLEGNDSSKVKVEKPQITPLPINRDAHSDFYNQFVSIQNSKIEPVFVDYDNEIQRAKINKNIDFSYIKNNNNDLFSLYYVLEIGSNHNRLLPLAINYLEYLGTNKYSVFDLNKEYFKYGLNFGVQTSADQTRVYINGLGNSFDKALQLLEHLFANAVVDTLAYRNYVDDIIKSRNDAKLNQNAVRSALLSYGKYGEDSPLRDIISEQELRNLNPQDLVNLIKDCLHYPHQIFYYGMQPMNEVQKKIEKIHKQKINKTPTEIRKYEIVETPQSTIYFVNYNLVQACLYSLSRVNLFDKNNISYVDVFNEYYGTGMSSIVFQEIRESKALAYSAYAYYGLANKINEYDVLTTLMLVSVDKLQAATSAMNELIGDMRRVDEMFAASKDAVLNRIATNRITKSSIYFSYLNNLRRDIDYDYRKNEYSQIENMSIDDFQKFFNENISGRNRVYLLIGNKNDIDFEALKEYGEVKELSLEELFNY